MLSPTGSMGGHVTVAGQRLDYEMLGTGRPLLFLNNIAVPSSSMRAFAPLLNSAGYQLVLVDRLGAREESIEAMAGHLGALLDAIPLRPWVWGWSQGAFLAQELALLRPDRVRGAVLLGTRGRPTRFFREYLLACEEIERGAVPDAVATVFELLATMSPGLLSGADDTVFASAGARGPDAVRDRARAVRSLRASRGYGDRLTALTGVRVPCLVLSFAHDLLCPPQLGREVAGAIPGCEYQEVPGAGHHGMVTHAAEVLSAVTAFLDRHSAEVGST
ncbi:MAG: alpha/beta hydrolase [Streptomyces sp.]|nr:alpha/beta hydrolase [Streptomyces sp.]